MSDKTFDSAGCLRTKVQPERLLGRKRIWLHTVSGLLVAGIAAPGVGYYEFRLQQHFNHNNIPVLATPAKGSLAVPHDRELTCCCWVLMHGPRIKLPGLHHHYSRKLEQTRL